MPDKLIYNYMTKIVRRNIFKRLIHSDVALIIILIKPQSRAGEMAQ